MYDLLFLTLLLVVIVAAAVAGLYHAAATRARRRRRRSVLLLPPEVLRQIAVKNQEESVGKPARRTVGSAREQLPPLTAPLSEQRLCLHCGTANLREATHCRRCGHTLRPDPNRAEDTPAFSAPRTRMSHGPVYAALLLIILASIAMILYQAFRLGRG